jgi:hypothetical protein
MKNDLGNEIVYEGAKQDGNGHLDLSTKDGKAVVMAGALDGRAGVIVGSPSGDRAGCVMETTADGIGRVKVFAPGDKVAVLSPVK